MCLLLLIVHASELTCVFNFSQIGLMKLDVPTKKLGCMSLSGKHLRLSSDIRTYAENILAKARMYELLELYVLAKARIYGLTEIYSR